MFGWSRRGAGVLLTALICAVLAVNGLDSTVRAQALIDYDADNDGLIEVTTEDQLSAIRWDLDGSGVVEVAAPTPPPTPPPSRPRRRGWAAPPRDALATSSRRTSA